MAHKGEKSNGSHYSSSGATKNVYSKKKRTSFVNDNAWWEKLSEGMKGLQPYSPQKMVRPFRGPGLLSRVEIGEKAWEKERADAGNFEFEKKYLKQFSQGFDNRTKSYKGKPTMVDSQGNLQKAKQSHFVDAMQDPWNARKKQKSDNASGY